MMVGEAMTIRPRRFILQAIHPDYACPAFETMFETDRLEELRALLGLDAADDEDFAKIYRLEPADIEALSQRIGVSFEAEGREVILIPYRAAREIPYLIHTGYELPLMLDGRKKFARMTHEYPPDQHLYEDRFDHYVQEGLLHKEVDVEPFGKRMGPFDGLRTVYYTPKGEEWRVHAWRLVERASKKGGWNDALERLEGMLFGYEDWQNDWWADRRRKQLRQYGTILVYLAVTPSELAAIESLGFRALPPLDRMIEVAASFADDLEAEEKQRLMRSANGTTLVRLRTKALPFLDLMPDPRERFNQLPADRIKDLNGLILEKIELA